MLLQFGAGNFLRAFVDLFVSEAGDEKIVVVQSTGAARAEALNRAGGRYHVAIQGWQDGAAVDRTTEVRSIAKALHAETQWEEVLAAGRSAELRWIVSNTTEAGLALDPADERRLHGAPRSFPAKLLAVLLERCEAGLPGLPVVPCELIERNGERLRELVMQQAGRWSLPGGTLDWLHDGCRWVNNLVDRIVPGPPPRHALLASDPLLLSAEPFALWAVEGSGGFPLSHPAIVETDDLSPFYLRKVRILNGAHSALVAHAMPLGLATVRECLETPAVAAWLEALLFEEIVPVLEGRVEDPAGFARTTLDRFRNPFLEHRLSAIALHHETKLQVRLRPTYEEYRSRFGREPLRLASCLS